MDMAIRVGLALWFIGLWLMPALPVWIVALWLAGLVIVVVWQMAVGLAEAMFDRDWLDRNAVGLCVIVAIGMLFILALGHGGSTGGYYAALAGF